jgi:hypothetical protein
MRDSNRPLCGLFKQGNYLVGDRAVGAARDAALDGALDLVGGSGRTPDKAVREAGCGRRVVP